jgi:hypothetical protein
MRSCRRQFARKGCNPWSLISACYVPRATARAQRGKEARGFRRVRKPAVNSVVAVVFSYVIRRSGSSWGGFVVEVAVCVMFSFACVAHDFKFHWMDFSPVLIILKCQY